MATLKLTNSTLFDGIADELLEDRSVLIEGDRIVEVAEGPNSTTADQVIDLAGQTLLPGLIDAHVHVYTSELDLTSNMRRPWTYLAQYANRFLRNMLDCGFTTIRDVGGGDYGLAMALESGLVTGPRLFYGGRILSQTGGHADWRPQYEDDPVAPLCTCCGTMDQKLAVLADGVPDVLRAVREELRRGVSHIKILASGGVASPSDPVDNLQYADDEITAIVDETTRHGKYVAAHCHPASSIRRSVELGVRSIEHGTLIDEETAAFVAASDAYVVPTMAVIFALYEDGAELGLPPASVKKIHQVFDRAIAGLEIMKNAGIRLGFGTDLLGPHHVRQCTEFTIRKQVFSPLEILRQATSTNAEILCKKGELGCVAPGACADLIAVRGNPLEDIELLAANGAQLSLIIRGGSVHKNEP
jgi:imidazolonepropionase-like amidohydrolase